MIGNLRNFIIFVLAIAGVGISLMLTIKYVQRADIPCGYIADGCNGVAADHMAWGFGVGFLNSIPTPAFGAVMYGTLVILSMFRVLKPTSTGAGTASVLQWTIALVGVVVSAVLTAREATIHLWCEWCVSSAIIILVIFLIATSERFATAQRGRRLQREVA